jgi:hypothetical protein
MTVRDMLTALQALPRDAELLAFEAGCEFSWAFGIGPPAGRPSLLVAALRRPVLCVQHVWCTTAVLANCAMATSVVGLLASS